MKTLFEAFKLIDNEADFEFFVKDLCTPKEIDDIKERWSIAQLLYKGELSYREIARELSVAVATVTRVARFLRNEQNYGYYKILKKLDELEK